QQRADCGGDKGPEAISGGGGQERAIADYLQFAEAEGNSGRGCRHPELPGEHEARRCDGRSCGSGVRVDVWDRYTIAAPAVSCSAAACARRPRGKSIPSVLIL